MLFENLRLMTEQDLVDGMRAVAHAATVLKNQQAVDQLRGIFSHINQSASSPRPRGQGQTRDARVMDIQESIMGAGLPAAQRMQLSHLAELHKAVAAHMRKQKALRLYELLLASAMGDANTVKSLLQQGVQAKWADYDGRTALMVAAHEGQDAIIKILLANGAPVSDADAYGNTAL